MPASATPQKCCKTLAMDAEAAVPAAPDAPAPVAAKAPEPMQTEQPAAAAAQEERSEPQEAAQPPAAERPASASAEAEPAPSPAKAKKPAKAKAVPKADVADTSAITPGSRERKKVEHYKPTEAPAEKKTPTVQEVQRSHVYAPCRMYLEYGQLKRRGCIANFKHAHANQQRDKFRNSTVQGEGTKLRDIPNGAKPVPAVM